MLLTEYFFIEKRERYSTNTQLRRIVLVNIDWDLEFKYREYYKIMF